MPTTSVRRPISRLTRRRPTSSRRGKSVYRRADPCARLVELEGLDHVPWIGDADSIVEEAEDFLTGSGMRPTRPTSVLATFLFYRACVRQLSSPTGTPSATCRRSPEVARPHPAHRDRQRGMPPPHRPKLAAEANRGSSRRTSRAEPVHLSAAHDDDLARLDRRRDAVHLVLAGARPCPDQLVVSSSALPPARQDVRVHQPRLSANAHVACSNPKR